MPWTPQPPEPALFAAQNRQKRRSHLELPPATTEYGVTIAASLACYFIGRNRAVGMNSRGRTREFVQADRGERQLNKFLEALAVVDAAGDLPFGDLVATDGVRRTATTPWLRSVQMRARVGPLRCRCCSGGASTVSPSCSTVPPLAHRVLQPTFERTNGDGHTCVSNSP